MHFCNGQVERSLSFLAVIKMKLYCGILITASGESYVVKLISRYF